MQSSQHGTVYLSRRDHMFLLWLPLALAALLRGSWFVLCPDECWILGQGCGDGDLVLSKG